MRMSHLQMNLVKTSACSISPACERHSQGTENVTFYHFHSFNTVIFAFRISHPALNVVLLKIKTLF